MTTQTIDKGMIKETIRETIKEVHTIKETEIHLGEIQIQTILETKATQ